MSRVAGVQGSRCPGQALAENVPTASHAPCFAATANSCRPTILSLLYANVVCMGSYTVLKYIGWEVYENRKSSAAGKKGRTHEKTCLNSLAGAPATAAAPAARACRALRLLLLLLPLLSQHCTKEQSPCCLALPRCRAGCRLVAVTAAAESAPTAVTCCYGRCAAASSSLPAWLPQCPAAHAGAPATSSSTATAAPAPGTTAASAVLCALS